MYYHPNLGVKVDQDFQPFESKADTVTICFRVNVAALEEAAEFDPGVNGPLGVRGNDQTSGGEIDWGTTKVILSREENDIKGDPFWSGYVFIPKDSLQTGDEQAYKFFIENPGSRSSWEEGIDDHKFIYTASLLARSDTTLHWTYFENRRPTGKTIVDATVTFRVSTEALEGIGLFNRGLGDEIKVIGPRGFDVEVGTETDFIDLNFIPALSEWTAAEPFSKIPGDKIEYKYFVRWDSSRIDPASPNYIPNLVVRGLNDDPVFGNDADEDSGWEEPAVTGGGNRSHVYTDNSLQNTLGDFRF